MYMNQVVCKEGDTVDGMYLVVQGSIIYKKSIQYETPVEGKTKNKWFRDSVQKRGINRKTVNKDVAILESGDLIGFEEIFRNFILSSREKNQE